jgi:hypothetical protein
LEAEGLEIVQTPYRAPRAKTVAERRIRTMREECLGHPLIH